VAGEGGKEAAANLSSETKEMHVVSSAKKKKKRGRPEPSLLTVATTNSIPCSKVGDGEKGEGEVGKSIPVRTRMRKPGALAITAKPEEGRKVPYSLALSKPSRGDFTEKPAC